MSDKIEKALKKLSSKERAKVKEILLAIRAGKLEGLDVVKLKGKKGIYRARKGMMRIIFLQTESEIAILSFERRSETTYRLH